MELVALELIQKAVEYKMPAIGMSDHGNMFGAIVFYQAAMDLGIKPIIGCEIYLARGSRFDKTPQEESPYHIVLFSKDHEGYKNLMKLGSVKSLRFQINWCSARKLEKMLI